MDPSQPFQAPQAPIQPVQVVYFPQMASPSPAALQRYDAVMNHLPLEFRMGFADAVRRNPQLFGGVLHALFENVPEHERARYSSIFMTAYLALTAPDFVSPFPAAGPVHHGTQINKPALILNLPDEILVQIFRHVPDLPWECYHVPYAYTCKRFYRLMIPMVYENIWLPLDRMRREILIRTVQQNRFLGPMCRKLTIRSEEDHVDETYFPLLENMIRDFVNVVTLSVDMQHVRYDHQARTFVRRCLEIMTGLQDLSLYSLLSMVSVGWTMEAVDGASLKRLSLTSVSDAFDLDQGHEQNERGAKVSELCLSEWHGTPRAMARVLEWVQGLTFFCLHSFDDHAPGFDLPMFRSMLLPHKDTLVELRICEVGPREGRAFDLTDFTALQVLSLSWRSTGQHLDDENGPVKLVAPRLKEFRWHYGFDITYPAWNSFGEQEEKWVRKFASIAARRESPQCEINIDLTVGTPRYVSHGYPWDRMARLKDEFSQRGISITYNAPPITKAQWEAWTHSFEGNEDPDWSPSDYFHHEVYWFDEED